MKIVIAPDKFKNSLSGREFCDIVEAGIKQVEPHADIIKLPLADGGDGTIDVVNHYLKGSVVNVKVKGPFFQPIEASYLFSESKRIAFIEMAEASGVKLLNPEQLDCKNATTFGTGELILHAIKNGAAKIILGLGGSATNDCGIGMAAALGYQFFDEHHTEVVPVGANLSKIAYINSSNVIKALDHIEFEVACDVTNPLFGEQGAAYVYAAQKGANPDDVQMLDKGLKDFSNILNTTYGVDVQAIKGAGAAGGMGVATIVFLNGEFVEGIKLIKDIADFNTSVLGADWIISGEGKLDDQTLAGKTIDGILKSVVDKKTKVAVVCGVIELDKHRLKEIGISYASSVVDHAVDLNDALLNTAQHLRKMSVDFCKSQC